MNFLLKINKTITVELQAVILHSKFVMKIKWLT